MNKQILRSAYPTKRRGAPSRFAQDDTAVAIGGWLNPGISMNVGNHEPSPAPVIETGKSTFADDS